MFLAALLAACTQAESPAAFDSGAEVDDSGVAADDSGDSGTDAPPVTMRPDLVLRGGTIWPSGKTQIAIKDGVFVDVPVAIHQDVPIVDTTGQWLVPAFIDSHVHLVYYPVGAQLPKNGVAAAVDLAAPESVFALDVGDLRLVASGPMVTAVGGYPTRSWGSGGYGLETADNVSAAEASVDAVHGMGAGVIKLPVTGSNQLGTEAMAAASARAHDKGLKVATHALSDQAAADAAAAGADVLAHTPTAPLSNATLDAWGSRAVIGTLVAFGNGTATRDNLAALHSRGATVLYGTDLGNTGTVGIDGNELAAMVDAGLTADQVLHSGTTAPAAYWSLSDLGAIAPGKAASFLVLDTDPTTDVAAVASPTRVYIDGVEQAR